MTNRQTMIVAGLVQGGLMLSLREWFRAFGYHAADHVWAVPACAAIILAPPTFNVLRGECFWHRSLAGACRRDDAERSPAAAVCVRMMHMYWPIPGLKSHPERRWKQPDRIFFGFGACHILAGVFLAETDLEGFYGEWIVPAEGFAGNHMYATDGRISFDFHGYALRERLLTRYWRGYRRRFPGWSAQVRRIDFPLLDTCELNRRKHLGPDQFFADPIPRARRFIAAKKCPGALRVIV